MKPIGLLARWSWNLPRKKNSWVAFWLALVRQEFGVSGSQEQTNPVAQLSPPNGVKGYTNLRGAELRTSSVCWATSSSFTSL